MQPLLNEWVASLHDTIFQCHFQKGIYPGRKHSYDQISRLKWSIPAHPKIQDYFRKNGAKWSGFNY
jgi:hypothetical protein